MTDWLKNIQWNKLGPGALLIFSYCYAFYLLIQFKVITTLKEEHSFLILLFFAVLTPAIIIGFLAYGKSKILSLKEAIILFLFYLIVLFGTYVFLIKYSSSSEKPKIFQFKVQDAKGNLLDSVNFRIPKRNPGISELGIIQFEHYCTGDTCYDVFLQKEGYEPRQVKAHHDDSFILKPNRKK